MAIGTETDGGTHTVQEPDSVMVLGCRVHRLTLSEALDWMVQAIAARQPRQVVVVNANKFYLMSRSSELAAVVRGADLVLPEWAVVWAARRLGLPSLHFVAGVSAMREFLPVAAANGHRPYLLGAKPEVVTSLAEKLRCKWRVDVAGFHHGYLDTPGVEQAAIDDILRTRPDVLFAGLGSPRQELWLHAHKEVLRVPVSIGVGGSFDVLAGLKHDTPDWARGNGLEWLYRTWQDPRAYWKRYLLTNTWFVVQVAKARLTQARHLRRDAATG